MTIDSPRCAWWSAQCMCTGMLGGAQGWKDNSEVGPFFQRACDLIMKGHTHTHTAMITVEIDLLSGRCSM